MVQLIQNAIAMAFLIGLFSMLFVTPGIYARGIYTLEFGGLAMRDKVSSIIPVWNVMKAESVYTGKISKIAISAIFLIVSTSLRFLVVFTMPSNFVANMVTIILFVLAIVGYYVVNVLSVFMVLNDADTMGTLSKVMYSIVYPIGQYYVGKFLPTVVKHYEKEEDVFK